MANVKNLKSFTANCDAETNNLLSGVLEEMGKTLADTGLCVVLGGSYGRGDGGVRLDRENGLLYNDLDFFVFACKKTSAYDCLLKELSRKYEHLLHVDVDFSRVLSVKDIKNNTSRLMMQELKRGYFHVCGEDLLEKYLPEKPAEDLPFSEACRLLVNRGMGLLFAGEKISANSSDTDFILRNIYKAILGAGDAMLISDGKYRWKLAERLEMIEKSGMPPEWKDLYREAVEFKHSPHRQKKQDMISFWNSVRDFYRAAALHCSGDSKDFHHGIFMRCHKDGELSIANCIKYCIKSRSLPLMAWKHYTMPAPAILVIPVCAALNKMPQKIDEQLYQHWLIFN